RVPVRMTEHEVWGAVGTMLVYGVEEPAKIRLDAQRVEVIAAHRLGPGAGWIVARVEPHLCERVRREIVEAAVAIAQVDIVGIRLRRILVASDASSSSPRAAVCGPRR